MADIYAQARSLVAAVRGGPEWQRLRKAAGVVRADPSGEQLLTQLRLAQIEMQVAALQGQEPAPERQAALQRLLQQTQANSGLRQYLEAEQAYGAVLGEIRKVLAEIFEPDVPGQIKHGAK